jgi:hypothetical protein
MTRPVWFFFTAAMLCAQSLTAHAADSTTSTTSTPSEQQQVREQMEAKRDQLSGAARINAPAKTGAAMVLDAPVETEDAPAQVQKP